MLLVLLLPVLFVSCEMGGKSKELRIPNFGWKFQTGDNLEWAKPTFDDSEWETLRIGDYWENLGYKDYDGIAWYRREIELPKRLLKNSEIKDSIEFQLGYIDDNDQVYLNGKLIGQNGGLKHPFEGSRFEGSAYHINRVYKVAVADNLIKWDEDNLLAIRVKDNYLNGGMAKGPFKIFAPDWIDHVKTDLNKKPFVFKENSVQKSLVLWSETINKEIIVRVNAVVTCKKTKKELFSQIEKVTLRPGVQETFALELPKTETGHLKYIITETISGKVLTVEQDMPYVLTPKPGNEPKINNATIFGVRPDSPVLFSLAVSGARPMEYAVDKLPAGVSFNALTGEFRGSIHEKGTYPIRVTAKNKVGSDSETIQFVCGDTLALTPPMGWNNWNAFHCTVDETDISNAATSLVKNGLKDFGWSYVVIDDCWQGQRNTRGILQPNAKFPGMRKLTDYIHSLGLKAGIYSSPGVYTCQNYAGTYGFDSIDVATWANWGFDLIKYDWCSYGDSLKTSVPTEDDYKAPYLKLGEWLKQEPRDIIYNICQYGMGDVWKWGGSVNGNFWRTTEDITDTWESILHNGFSRSEIAAYAKPGNWNDADMLVVGWVALGADPHPTRLTPDEQYAHISQWALLASPLQIGCDLTKLDEFTRSLLTNREVIAINQDVLGAQATLVYEGGSYQVWRKPLVNGKVALGFYNMSTKYKKFSPNWKSLEIGDSSICRDVWRQKDLGVARSLKTLELNPHGVKLIVVN
jgi:hypothetical protein